jgi:hypothetical protein
MAAISALRSRFFIFYSKNKKSSTQVGLQIQHPIHFHDIT